MGPRRMFELALRGWLQRVLVHPAKTGTGATLEFRLAEPAESEEEG